jgi:hypothetical protein
MIVSNATRLALSFTSLLMVSLVTACQAIPATPDFTQLGLAAQGTLQIVGTQLALKETLTATAQRPTTTHTPTITPTPTQTPTATPTPTDTSTALPNGMAKAAGPLRAGPGRVFPIIRQLVGGEVLTILGKTVSGDWFSVIAEDGTPGWLPASIFDFAGDLTAIPVLTDLPPTPTFPPPTLTPLPTATPTPSPYTCDFYIQHSPAVGEILLIGTNWPPDTEITIAVNGFIWPFLTQRTDANGAFQISTPDRPGTTRQFTASASICSRTVQFP